MRFLLVTIFTIFSLSAQARCKHEYPDGEYFEVEILQCDSYQEQAAIDLKKAEKRYNREIKTSNYYNLSIYTAKKVTARVLEKTELISWHDGNKLNTAKGASIKTINSTPEEYLVTNYKCPKTGKATTIFKKPAVCCDVSPPRTLKCLSSLKVFSGVMLNNTTELSVPFSKILNNNKHLTSQSTGHK